MRRPAALLLFAALAALGGCAARAGMDFADIWSGRQAQVARDVAAIAAGITAARESARESAAR